VKRVVLLCGVLAVAGFLAASPAGALTISAVAITLDASNTPNPSCGFSSSQCNSSAVSILGAGGNTPDAVFASMSGETRYASNVWSDGSFGSTPASTTNSYNMSLSITADAGTTYDIVIESLFSGVLQTVNDSTFGEAAASVSAVTVTLNSAVSVANGTSAQMIAMTYYTEQQGISQSGINNTLTGQTGTTNLSFNVLWTTLAHSNSDEAAVLLGLDEAGGPPGSSGVSVTAGEYPSLAAGLSEDGHFLKVTATVTSVTAVPEPGTGVLLAMGLAGIVAQRRRSRA
jgi:hypothetical protein